MKDRFKNQCKDSRSYPGADADSDHNLVMAKCCWKFKRLQRTKSTKLQVHRLRDGEVARDFEREMETRMGG
jgi:hypothetical protein